MSKPLISIVTPSFNQGHFIEQTLLSIKGQSYSNIEHIVADGGSTDGTHDILKRYEGTYNMRWSSEPDTGMYNAINKGFAQAKGDIFAYLNTDDTYMPWSVEVAVDNFTKHPDVGLAHGGMLQATTDHSQLLRLQLPVKVNALKTGHPLWQPAVFWRREVYQKIDGFNEELTYMGDVDFWRRAILFFNVLDIEEIMAIEYSHDKRFSVVNRRYMEKERQELDSKYPPLSGANFLHKLLRKLINRFGEKASGIVFIFSYFYRNKDRKNYPYAKLLSIDNFKIDDPWGFLFGCIPFCNKGYKSWSFHGKFEWTKTGLTYNRG